MLPTRPTPSDGDTYANVGAPVRPEAGGRVVVLQHLAVEDPGSLGDLLRHAGLQLTIVELDEGQPIPSLDEFDLMLVMGGPMDVWQEDRVPVAGRREGGHPPLGARPRTSVSGCVSRAPASGRRAGRDRRPDAQPEIGVVDVALTRSGLADSVFSRLPATIRGLQWHGAQVRRSPSRRRSARRQPGLRHAGHPHRVMPPGACSSTSRSAVPLCPSGPRSPNTEPLIENLEQGDIQWLAEAVAMHLEPMKDTARMLLSGVLLGCMRRPRADGRTVP